MWSWVGQLIQKLVCLIWANKNELTKEKHKARLTKINEVYPELIKNFRIAEGAIWGHLGLQRQPTFEEYNIEDFRELFARQKIPSGKVEELIKEIKNNKSLGISQINTYFRELAKNRIDREVQNANNYFILNGIHLSPEVKKMGEEARNSINCAYAQLIPFGGGDYKKNRDTVKKTMDALELQISQEI